MTEGIELRGGGAIAVDTETLRRTAARFDATASELDAVCAQLGPVQLLLLEHRGLAWAAAAASSALGLRIREVSDTAARLAERLRAAAAIYELVELNARHQAAFFAGDAAAMERIDARRAQIMAADPDAMEAARGFEAGRAVMWPAHLVRQSTEFGQDVGSVFGMAGGVIGGVGVGGFVLGTAATVGIGGWGRISRDARLTGPPPPVALVAAPAVAATSPTGLRSAAERMPQGGDARVRVERYTMADGSRQYAVYVAGTRSPTLGGADPWDAKSNVQLYRGERSASYQATVEALEAAGARPGDAVHAFGHSQGAMITSHLALEGDYDVRTLVSYGSPVEADVSASTLNVSIRHTDDPVSALAGGGHMGGVGGPGSMIAEREFHPSADAADLRVPAHSLASYAETAELVDASADPRVGAVHDVFDELGRAVDVDAVEYAATRG